MGLYVKFQLKENPGVYFNRFKSAFNFFGILRNKIKFSNLKIAFYLYEPLKELNPSFEYGAFEFGLLNKYMKKLNEMNIEHKKFSGFDMLGYILIKNIRFKFRFILNPQAYCNKSEVYDIRFEIFPNFYGDVLEDLKDLIPNFKDILLDRVKEYNFKKKELDDLFIKRAVLSGSDGEFNIKNWAFLYFKEPKDLLLELYDSSKDLDKAVELGNRQIFSNMILDNNRFALLMDKYSQEDKVDIACGSISLLPKDINSMNKFVDNLNSHLINIAQKVFISREKAEKELDSYLRKII